jgi:phosphatidate phosphatase APP1
MLVCSLKLENFTRFAALYPEFQFVFFGDSGQGDALLASNLLHAFPNRVLGTFIHDVTPGSSTTGDGQQKAIYQA